MKEYLTNWLNDPSRKESYHAGRQAFRCSIRESRAKYDYRTAVERDYGETPSQEELCLLLLDDTIGEKAFAYYVQGFAEFELKQTIEEKAVQFHEKFTARLPEKGLLRSILDAESDIKNSIRKIERHNPFLGIPQGAIRIDELANMHSDSSTPFPEKLQLKITRLFADASESDEIDEAIFFAFLSRINPTEIRELLAKHVPQDIMKDHGDRIDTKLQNLQTVIQRYLGGEQERILQEAYINPTDEDLSIFPILIATSFAMNTSLLPLQFSSILREGMIPGLSDATVEMLERYHSGYFTSFEPQLLAQLNEEALDVYTLAQKTFHDGEIEQTFDKIDNATRNMQVSNQPSLLNEATFSRVRAYLSGYIHTIGHIGDIAVDIAAMSGPTIDVLLSIPAEPHEKVVTITFTRKGKILGVPAKGNGTYEHLLLVVTDAINTFMRQFRLDFTKQPSQELAPLPRPSIVTKRRGVNQQPSDRKRNGENASGNTLSVEDDEEMQESDLPHYGLRTINRYVKSLAKLPNDVQLQAALDLQSIKSRHKRIKRLVAEYDYDFKVFSARVKGLGYRILFVEGAKDTEFYVVDIGSRQQIYRTLKQIGELSSQFTHEKSTMVE